jgi:hypothetical protein
MGEKFPPVPWAKQKTKSLSRYIRADGRKHARMHAHTRAKLICCQLWLIRQQRKKPRRAIVTQYRLSTPRHHSRAIIFTFVLLRLLLLLPLPYLTHKALQLHQSVIASACVTHCDLAMLLCNRMRSRHCLIANQCYRMFSSDPYFYFCICIFFFIFYYSTKYKRVVYSKIVLLFRKWEVICVFGLSRGIPSILWTVCSSVTQTLSMTSWYMRQTQHHTRCHRVARA